MKSINQFPALFALSLVKKNGIAVLSFFLSFFLFFFLSLKEVLSFSCQKQYCFNVW